MVTYQEFLISEYFGNTGQEYLTAIVAFLIAYAILYIFRSYIIHIIKRISSKTKSKIDDYFIDAILSIHSPFYLYISFYISLRFLILPDNGLSNALSIKTIHSHSCYCSLSLLTMRQGVYTGL